MKKSTLVLFSGLICTMIFISPLYLSFFFEDTFVALDEPSMAWLWISIGVMATVLMYVHKYMEKQEDKLTLKKKYEEKL